MVDLSSKDMSAPCDSGWIIQLRSSLLSNGRQAGSYQGPRALGAGLKT